MNLEYQYMVRPIPGKPRIDERRTFRRLRALVWTRARGLGGNFSRSPEKLLHRVKTARSCHRRFEATSAWEQRWNLQVQVVHIADEIETKRAANRVNLSLLDEILEVRTKLENESNSNGTRSSIFSFWKKVAKMIEWK